MITEQLVYKCECDKCGYIWTPKTNTVPARCASCNVKTWHDQTGEIVALDMPKVRMTYDAIFDVVQGMSETDRGTLIDAFRPREVVKVADDKQARLERAREALMSVGHPKVETVDQWQGWTEPAQSYDDQTGEMRTFRRHIKSGRVQWLDSESCLSGV